MSSKKDRNLAAGSPDITYVELGTGSLDPTDPGKILLSDEAIKRLNEILDAPAEPTVGLLKLMGAKVPTVH